MATVCLRGGGAAASPEWAAAGDDPEVALQKKNRAEPLRRSLPRLSPEHREVIDLAYYHGKSVKEIAEIVSISEATLKTRMFYARRKLAELVEKRWSRFAGQFGGLANVDSGFDYAANFSSFACLA
jgi:DNA-directed RNA polymerase specialized sigma24 family protein